MRTLLASVLVALSLSTQAQVELNRIGQTPGGAANHVNYDSISHRLFVGAGTSLWVYDMTNPSNPIILAKRPFTGMINETILYNGVLFVAATHDGLYALDANSDTLSILDHADIIGTFGGDVGAYDMCMSGDTIFLADKFEVRRFKYNLSTGLTHITPNFNPWGSFCIAEKGNYIAIGKQPVGEIKIYNKNNLSSPVATWTDTLIHSVQNLRFSDLHDNILYVCGGPTNILFTESYLFALELSGNQLNAIDSFSVNGLFGIAQSNITGIDSRNDTLYLATTGGISLSYGFPPLVYQPIIDATNLPSDTMKMIGYVNNLWNFDVSLLRGTPYLATASEWLGVLMHNTTTSQNLDGSYHIDTLPSVVTGGWTQKSEVRGDTLWVAHEGWGLAAYNIDSLMFSNGYMTDPIILHMYETGSRHYFVGDFSFIDDTLLVLSNGTVYNLKPWQQGGLPDSSYNLNCSGVLNNAYTDVGQRLVVGSEDLFGNNEKMLLFDPYDQTGINLKTIDIFNNPKSITVKDDTVFYGYKDTANLVVYLVVAIIENDDFVKIDSIATSTNAEINSIAVENNIVAIGKNGLIEWYSWDGNSFTLLNSYSSINLLTVDMSLKNGYLYVADKLHGVKIFDLSATFLAEYSKYVGWCDNFGNEDICVGDDGKIYLSDFNAGVVIIQPFDTTLSSSESIATMNQTIKVYPNPASNNLTVEFKDNATRDISLSNMKGQVIIQQKNITGSKIILNTGNIAKGVYLLNITGKNENFSTKIVVKQ